MVVASQPLKKPFCQVWPSAKEILALGCATAGILMGFNGISMVNLRPGVDDES